MTTQTMDAVTEEDAPAQAAKGFLAIEGAAASAEEAIRLCGAALEREGYVTDAFALACIERERSYPTGLCTRIPVALPHCKSDAILKSALCYLRLPEPVPFHRMDDDEQVVECRHVFNLAIAPGDHLEFLSKTMRLLSDDSLLGAFDAMGTEEIAVLLRDRLG